MAVGSMKGSGRAGAKRVVRTGLALVHANEIVYPAAGSEAQATQAVDDASADIEVHYPVVIEIVGAAGGVRGHRGRGYEDPGSAIERPFASRLTDADQRTGSCANTLAGGAVAWCRFKRGGNRFRAVAQPACSPGAGQ